MRRLFLPTDPSTTFSNAGAQGISRLVTVGEHLFVNNIARNYELVTPVATSEGGVALRRDAHHNVTSFPGQDIPSQLDLDAHGVFVSHGVGALLVYDHHGRTRAFRWPPPSGPLVQLAEWRMLGDTERVVMAQGCFITSSPRGQYSADPPAEGLFISEPLPETTAPAFDAPGPLRQLRYRQELADWGVITALAVSPDQALLAVGTRGRVGLFPLAPSPEGVSLGGCLWQSAVAYHVQWLDIAPGGEGVLAGGYSLDADDQEGAAWDACRGGDITAFAPGGARVHQAPAPEDTAWGYAGNPLVAAPGRRIVYAADRRGGLHAVDLSAGAAHCVDQAPVDTPSLGIGHVGLLSGRLYAAFTRGGFRLFAFGPD